MGRRRSTALSSRSLLKAESLNRNMASTVRFSPARWCWYSLNALRSSSGSGIRYPTATSGCSMKDRPTRSRLLPMPAGWLSLETSSRRAVSIAPAARTNVRARTLNWLPDNVAQSIRSTRPPLSARCTAVAWSTRLTFSARAKSSSYRSNSAVLAKLEDHRLDELGIQG